MRGDGDIPTSIDAVIELLVEAGLLRQGYGGQGLLPERPRALLETDINNLYILPAGNVESVPADILGTVEMHDLINELAEKFDRVILDGPAILGLADARAVGRFVDGVLLVMRAGSHDSRPLSRVRQLFAHEGLRPAGIVFNGFRERHEDFADNLPVFGPHFRCLVIDMPGYGGSCIPDELTGPDPALAAPAVLNLLDELGVEQAHFLGNSMGGGVAAQLALLAPERVARLVLMGPGGIGLSVFSPSPSDASSAFTGAACSPCRAPQCIGTKTVPGRKRATMRAGAARTPRRERTSTTSPAAMPSPDASPALISTNGSGQVRSSTGTLPVRVIVCHWSRTRPVVSTKGNAASGGSAGGA